MVSLVFVIILAALFVLPALPAAHLRPGNLQLRSTPTEARNGRATPYGTTGGGAAVFKDSDDLCYVLEDLWADSSTRSETRSEFLHQWVEVPHSEGTWARLISNSEYEAFGSAVESGRLQAREAHCQHGINAGPVLFRDQTRGVTMATMTLLGVQATLWTPWILGWVYADLIVTTPSGECAGSIGTGGPMDHDDEIVEPDRDPDNDGGDDGDGIGTGGGMDWPDEIGGGRGRPSDGGDPDEQYDSSKPTPNKAVIRNNLIYHFMDVDHVTNIASSAVAPDLEQHNFELFSNEANRVEDWFRLMTLRLWYSYGWSMDQINYMFDREIPASLWQHPYSPRPMFGYFPVTDQGDCPNLESENRCEPILGTTPSSGPVNPIMTNIQSDLGEFHREFSSLAIRNQEPIRPDVPGDPLSRPEGADVLNSSDNYFDQSEFYPRPVPLIYISEFAPETGVNTQSGYISHRLRGLGLISSLTTAVSEFMAASDNIKIKYWARSLIKIKRFDYRELDPGRFYPVPPDGDSDRGDVGFEIIVDGYIDKALELKQHNPGLDPPADSVAFPRRYYDYVFEFPTVDNMFDVDATYGSHALGEFYEDTTSPITPHGILGGDDQFSTLLEPVIPNIYIIEFAKIASIEQYYKLISLNREIRELPLITQPAFSGWLEDFNYSNLNRYIMDWSKAVRSWGNQSGISMSTSDNEYYQLAKEYRGLIFSNHFGSQYNVITRMVDPIVRDPYYFDLNFNLIPEVIWPHIPYGPSSDAPNGIVNNIFNENIHVHDSGIHDPIVNLIKDTEISVKRKPYFAEIETLGHIGTHASFQNPANPRPKTTPYVLDGITPGPTDYIYKANRIWDFNEWVKLYCALEPDDGGAEWDLFFEAFPEQFAMLEADPADLGYWLHSSTVRENPDLAPVPVGGLPGNRGIMTPDGEDWGECVDMAVFKDAMVNINGRMKELMEDSKPSPFRTYKNVVDGELAYCECLFYRLEKKDRLGHLIQNFFFPANLLKDAFRYVDSQIRYGETHQFQLYGYYFVLGNEYWYEKETVGADFRPAWERVNCRHIPPYVTADGVDHPWELGEDNMCHPPEEAFGPLGLLTHQDLKDQADATGGAGYDAKALVYNDFSEHSVPEWRLPYTGQAPTPFSSNPYAEGASLRQKLWFNPKRLLENHAEDGTSITDWAERLANVDGIWRQLYIGRHVVVSNRSDIGAEYPGNSIYAPEVAPMIGIFDPSVYASQWSPPLDGIKPDWLTNWESMGKPFLRSPGGREVPILIGNYWYAFFIGNLNEGDYTWYFTGVGEPVDSRWRNYFKDNFGYDNTFTVTSPEDIEVPVFINTGNWDDAVRHMGVDGFRAAFVSIRRAWHDSWPSGGSALNPNTGIGPPLYAGRRSNGIDAFSTAGGLLSAGLSGVSAIEEWFSEVDTKPYDKIPSVSTAYERANGVSQVFPRYGGIDGTHHAGHEHPTPAGGAERGVGSMTFMGPGTVGFEDSGYYNAAHAGDGLYQEYFSGCCRRLWGSDFVWQRLQGGRRRSWDSGAPLRTLLLNFSRIAFQYNMNVPDWGYISSELALHSECTYREIPPQPEEADRPPSIDEYTFAVHNRPHPVLIEAKVFSNELGWGLPHDGPTVTVLSDPPIPPDVEIIPYRSIKDKILLTMNSNIGRYRDHPVIIETGDVDKFRGLIGDYYNDLDIPVDPNDITSYNIEDYYLMFRSDDYPRYFEIYRVDTPPLSYRSFEGASKTTLDNHVDGVLARTANATIQEIVPNKKYWYTFRVVDYYGNISNPTGVLEFEMVDTGNSIFPIIQEYSFPKPEVSYHKPMRRYLKISPSRVQESVNVDSVDGFISDSRLGQDVDSYGDSVWNQKYKLRLTSKLSGKRLDVNFTFKQKGLCRSEDFPCDE